MDADFAAVSSGAGAPVDATAFAGADVDADDYADFCAVRTLNPARPAGRRLALPSLLPA